MQMNLYWHTDSSIKILVGPGSGYISGFFSFVDNEPNRNSDITVVYIYISNLNVLQDLKSFFLDEFNIADLYDFAIFDLILFLYYSKIIVT